ncbi:MAG: hydrolase, partial [Tannerellaceae bacterium]
MVKTSIKIPLALYFIFATVVIAYFFPKEGKFRYQFNEGKPWRYGLLTATSDFPIYKSEAEVNAERDSVLKKFVPYYLLQGNVEKDQMAEFEDEQKEKLADKELVPYINYIRESLKKIYAKGIVSNKAMQEAESSRNEIMLVKDNIASPESILNHFTPKTAYEYIIDHCPASFNKQTLQSFNLEKYILENIAFDPKMSDKVKQELLQSVSPASGMIQAGERIVDRGQIIDSHTFRVLNSLKSVEEQRAGSKQRDRLMFLGQLSIVIGLMFCFGFYLYLFRPNYFYNKRNLGFLLLSMVVSCVLTGLTVSYNLFNVYIIPYAILPIVVRTFFDSRTAIFTHTVAMLICSIMVPFSYEFLVMQLVAGMVVVFSLKELSQRSHLIRSTFFIFLTYAIVYTSLVLYQDADIAKINWKMFLYFGINFVLLMFSYLLVYILEKSFGFISNI